MSKTRHKGKRVNTQDRSNDVTLNDFANSNVNGGGGRLKKNALRHVTTEVKLLSLPEDDRAWDEKLDELAPVDDDEDVVRRRPGRRRKKTSSGCEDSQSGEDYPMDVWYLISEFIAPEDVGTFAAICHTALAVVNSANFWFSLYKRTYKDVDSIPELLRPGCMVRRYGLRALVIRSMYFSYAPFVLRYQTKLESDPHKLLGRRCVIAWSQKLKGKEQWIYSFKLKETTDVNIHGRRETQPKPDLLEMLDDIRANVDDGCKVLQVKSNHYYPLPMVTGQALIDCTVKMSSDFGSHCLLLQFGSGPSRYQPCPVSVSSVVNMRVLDWWHPAFAHGEQMHGGLFSALLPKDCDFSIT